MNPIKDKIIDSHDMSMVDFKTLSDMGLVFAINKLLHPFGLALSYDPDTGESEGALVADDGKWEYSAEVEKRCSIKLDAFAKLLETMSIQDVVKHYKEKQ